MAISGSYDFSLNRDEIINKAYTMVGAVAIGEDPTADELTEGGRTLNLMLKGWQTEGIGLWLNQEITVNLTTNTVSYDLGASIPRPLEIIEAKRVTSGVHYPLLQIRRSEYLSIADKATAGTVSQFYYDPQLTTGVLYVWPPSDNATDTLKLTIKKPISDFDASTDDGEFPTEWLDAVVSNLAIRIGIENGIDVDPGLKELAATSKSLAKEFDTEKDIPSYDPALDRGHLISEAYSLAGVVPIGSDPTIDELLDGIRSLNSMLKSWQTEGIGLWLNQEVTLFLKYEGKSYSLGPSGDHMSASVVKTEIATAASSGDTDIVVDSIIGITNGDYLGIELDDGTVQWTTINGVPSGSTIAAAAALTDDAAVDNHIYTYTTKAGRPLQIIEGRRVSEDGNETPLLLISRNEYMALSNKGTSGIINQIFYDPQLTNGMLYVWPTCADVKDTLKLTIKVPIADFDAGNSEGELPPEWRDAIISNLALRIAMKQPPITSPDGRSTGFMINPELKRFAVESKFMARTFDTEKTSIFFQPERR